MTDDTNISFIDYIKTHSITKNDNVPSDKKTNTRIGDKSSSILGRTLSIPDKKNYKLFLKLYAKDIISKKKKEYFTEKQLKDDGPFLIDLDFRYEPSIRVRQHNTSQIEDFVGSITEVLKSIYQMDDNTEFKIFVLQKDDVNHVSEKNITKDGIHIIVTLKADRSIQNLLRNKLLPHIDKVFEKLPLTNTASDIYDDGVTAGHVNWQLIGSRKPNNEPYKLSNIYDISYDEDDDEMCIDELDVEAFDMTDVNNIYKLSARNDEHPSLFMKSSFLQEYENFKNKTTRKVSEISNNNVVAISSSFDGSDRNILLQITNEVEMKLYEEQFKNSLNTRDFDILIKEIYEYVMALPEQYYGNNSYNKWIRVCWMLCNALPRRDDYVFHRERLLFVWILFSSQSSSFAYSSIPDLIMRWDDGISRLQTIDNALTFRSLTFWVREDNPTKYNEIHSKTLEHFVNQTIYGITGGRRVLNERERIGDEVYSELLYQLHKDNYVCVSVSNNKWYKYCNGKWSLDDSGVSLHRKINKLKKIFMNKITEVRITNPNENEDDENSSVIQIHKRLNSIVNLLGDQSFRDKIFKGSKILFYDEAFIQKLDTNKDLVAFENGVIDIVSGVFRKGRPDDFVSLSTNINYIPEFNDNHSQIISSINRFLHELYPEQDLYDYMWEHLASMMTGHNKQQNAHFYLGVGANGKSALIELMALALGDYYQTIPTSLLTDRRVKIGGTAPELVKLKGKRLAIVQEPQKDDILNEGVFKQLTSANDDIQARGLYVAEPISFKAQFKLVVATNYLLTINATDNGTWRRIAVVQHKSVFTDNPVQGDKEKPYQFKVDREMGEKFKLWKEVFASMLVKKAIQTKGDVQSCSQVTERSKEYQESQDCISEFIQEKIRQTNEKGAKLSKQELSSEFSIWYSSIYGRGGPAAKELYDRFNNKYGNAKNSMWYNIRIVYGQETDSDDDSDDDIEGDESAFLT